MNRGRTRNDGSYSTPRGRGRSARPAGRSVYRPVPARVDGSNSNVTGNKDGELQIGRPTSRQMSVGNILKQFDSLSTSDSQYQQGCHLPGTIDVSSDPGRINLVENTPEALTPSSNDISSKNGPLQIWRPISRQMPVGSISKQFDSLSTSDSQYQKGSHLPGTIDISSEPGRVNLVENTPEIVAPSSKDISSRKGALQIGRPTSWQMSVGSISKQFDSLSTPDSQYQQGCHLPGTIDVSSDPGRVNLVENTPEAVAPSSKDISPKKGPQCGRGPCKEPTASIRTETSDSQAVGVPFDICPVRAGNVVMLKATLYEQNKLKRNEAKRNIEGQNISVLRSGMILLKRHISSSDQVKIVKTCRDLGLGSGGFYDPSYRDGGKLHLKMMCLGRNWDPEESKYDDVRPIDGAKPPSIPTEFCHLVKGAIQASHSFLREFSKMPNVENELPSMSPNICIVNFYTKTGRLGLHQDKDESQESLQQRLPVVSFSIGDSAEFLYGDERDIDKAEKVILESGDVVIFGGKSRLIFHGVTNILPNIATKALREETNLLPGRLNLTFRQE